MQHLPQVSQHRKRRLSSLEVGEEKLGEEGAVELGEAGAVEVGEHHGQTRLGHSPFANSASLPRPGGGL